MTSFPSAPAQPAWSTPPPGGAPVDPTAVMPRRILAWVIDFVLYMALAIALFTQLAVQDSDEAGRFVDDCQQLQDAGVSDVCFDLNGDVVFLDDDSDVMIMNLFALGWFVGIYVLLQGLTGASIGKFMTGIRVVNEQGQICGIGRSFLRSLLWVVDAAPWIIPGLVGFITGLTSTGHRRVGDMAATTYVVSSSSVGTPITVGGSTGIPNYPPTGPQSAYGSAWAPNPNAPVTPPTWGTPAPPQPQPQPQWDAARNTYIQWSPGDNSWLEWDDQTNQWKPIST